MFRRFPLTCFLLLSNEVKISSSQSLYVSIGIDFTTSSECCQVGFDNYQSCSVYCCKNTGMSSLYDECCSSHSRRDNFNIAKTSDCESWWTDTSNTWVYVIIGVLVIGVFGICIKCCVSSHRRNADQYYSSPGVLPMQHDPAAYPAYGAPRGYGATGYQGQTYFQGASEVVHPPPNSGNIGATGFQGRSSYQVASAPTDLGNLGDTGYQVRTRTGYQEAPRVVNPPPYSETLGATGYQGGTSYQGAPDVVNPPPYSEKLREKSGNHN